MTIVVPVTQPHKQFGMYRQSDSPAFDYNFPSARRGIFSNQVSRGSVTVTFDQEVETGTFIDGSPWIALNGQTVSITAVTPTSTTGRNGGMVNPTSSTVNGSDDRIQFNTYNHAENVTSSEKLPRQVSANESYVLTVSSANTATGDNQNLDEIQVVTVLNSSPPENSFRPPYSGTSKPIFNESDIAWASLPALATTANTPSIATCNQYFTGGPFIKIRSSWVDRYWHATVNHSTGNYAREIAKSTGQALVRAMLSGTQAEKRDLVVNLIQAGIDCYGAAQAGLNWNADGGQNQGAKMLVMFAGKMLNNQSILDIANWGITDIFQEDQQAFYIDQKAVDISNGNDAIAWNPDTRNVNVPYQSADIGRPEWGLRRYLESGRIDMAWDAYYRDVNGPGQFLHCIAAYLLGVQAEWNHSAFFDYWLNRYYIVESGNDPATTANQGIGTGSNDLTTFASEVYLAHINSTPSNTINAPSSVANVKLGQVAITQSLEPR